jgi:dihydroneopterin aldolase
MKKTSLTKLSIVNAEYYAYHGVKEEERLLGGKYQVDLDMWYDATGAIIKDNVQNALNYEEAMFTISEVINAEEPYFLVETICNEILNLLMEKFPQLVRANVKVRKMSVPMRRVVGHIEAEQSIERD